MGRRERRGLRGATEKDEEGEEEAWGLIGEADMEVGIWDRKVENGDVEVGVRNRHY